MSLSITTSDICPVCGMTIDDPDTAPRSTYRGTTYRFCCDSCKQQFDADPDKYVSA